MAEQFDVERGWQPLEGEEKPVPKCQCCVCGVRFDPEFEVDDVNQQVVCLKCFEAIKENGWGRVERP